LDDGVGFIHGQSTGLVGVVDPTCMDCLSVNRSSSESKQQQIEMANRKLTVNRNRIVVVDLLTEQCDDRAMCHSGTKAKTTATFIDCLFCAGTHSQVRRILRESPTKQQEDKTVATCTQLQCIYALRDRTTYSNK